MSRFIQVLNAVLLMALIGLVVLAIWFLWGVHLTVETTLRDFHTTVLEAGLTLKNLREASLEWKKASKAQSEASTELLRNSTKALSQVSLLVSHADTELNSVLMPSISTAIENEGRALSSSQMKLDSTLDAALATSQALQKTILDADAQISDPNIKQSLQNVAEGTKQLAVTSEQVAAIATDGRQVADKARETYLKPVNLWWAVVKQLISSGGSLAQMIK